METYIKKFFWLVPAFAAACCAYFLARTVNHLIESHALSTSTKVAMAQKYFADPSASKVTVRTKEGEGIFVRNMFCSACVPAEDAEDDVVDSDRPPLTSLPLRLLATNLATNNEYSFATILNTSSNRQGAYSIGQEIPKSGAIVRISAKYIDFENNQKKRVERISLLTEAKEPPPSSEKAKSTTPAKKASKKRGILAMVEDGVNRVSDTEFELDRKVVDKILENPAATMSGARIVPSLKNGKSNGFRLYAIRPNSVYALIGLKNGDTIHSINGMELTSLDKGLEIYAKLRSASNLSVTATRRGKPISLNYSIK